MKLNKKQLMLGLLFVALASRMYAADDKALIAQAREFARQLQMHCNQAGSSIVSRLVDSIEHLMPFVGKVEAQTEQITLLEEQVAQASQQREAIMRLLGIQVYVAAPVVSTASVPEESVTLEGSSSSSSQSTLIDDASEARPNKRTERTESSSSLPVPTAQRPRVGRPARAEATFACEVCDTLYTTERSLQRHENSQVHRLNERSRRQ